MKTHYTEYRLIELDRRHETVTVAAGTKLGRYEVRSQLGAGGRGEVYLVWDTQLDRKAALKILPVDVAANRQRTERFMQEAKAASQLSHPNIAQIMKSERRTA